MSAIVGIPLFLLVCCCATNAPQSSLPAKLPPAIIQGGTAQTCPSTGVLDQVRNATKVAVQSILDTVIPALNNRPTTASCPCGGPG